MGAGNGPYADKLRSRFQHVIVSDIASNNIALARDRLGTGGFRYRAAGVEDSGGGGVAELWCEMEDVVGDRTIRGHWPAKIILATKR